MKYLIYKTTEGEIPLLFPNYLKHKDAAVVAGECPVTSAGSVRIGENGAFECFGKSASLNLKSREKHDSVLIRHYLKSS